MLYSEVIENNLILPKKKKYTVADCKSIQTNSLFKRGGTLSNREAGFIVMRSAIFHGTAWSKNVKKFKDSII